MDEQEAKGETEGVATEDNDEGIQPKTDDLITDAYSAAKRLEEANAKTEELIKRQENLHAKQLLSGHTEAGREEKPKEETAQEYMKRVMSNDLN